MNESPQRRAPRKTIEEHRLKLRNLVLEDFDDIAEIMNRVYKTLGGTWPRKKYIAQLHRFPEGQLAIEDNGKVVAAAFSVIIDYRYFGDDHTYDEITGSATLSTHDPDGDILYGVDVFVHPDYRDMRLGRRLYDARKELCYRLNLRAIIAGGRIPGYKKYKNEMTPQEYILQVRRREIYDPILTFQIANDFQVKRVLQKYLPEDRESQGFATLLQWNNIYYEGRKRNLLPDRKTEVRLGAVQWQMRRVESLDSLMGQVEFFVDALANYNCDFCLFPEFFNAPLMALANTKDSAEAIKALAEFTPAIKEGMLKLAVSYNINIISGSMPLVEDGRLYNISYLLHRSGKVDEQLKLHITPSEKKFWAMDGGDRLQVFDTDAGKIGILICYDVEFPELSRLLASKGMQILFVPFWTDTKNGFLRVQRCAQARAIENECYVAMSGSVGNLPNVDNVEIQYAQSAVYTPSDFAFPHDATLAETTPNTEMTLIVDLDMDKLKELHYEGTVQNKKDRREDLYSIKWLGRLQ